ncbi:MAG TPA: DUF2085 domain-containing protein [Anaerolineales bacterium]|nr:DUF2085 domain-containing protein [Anaerolineales bacterium]
MSTPTSNPPERTPDAAQTSPNKTTIFNRLPTRALLAIVTLVFVVGWLLNTPPGLEGKADAVGYAICHQIVERSFAVNGQPIALCARCTGMYLGAMIAMAYQLFLGRRRSEWPGKGMLVVLGVFFLAFALDGTNSAAKLFLGHDLLYTPNNTLRLITGTGMGIAMGVMVQPTFNQTLWKNYDPRPYFMSWKSFAGMLAVEAAVVLMVLSEKPFFLIPFSYISAAGVVIFLVLLYSMILMVIFDHENKIEKTADYLPWMLGGILVAFMHIGGVDYLRYLITGTWEGFSLHLG